MSEKQKTSAPGSSKSIRISETPSPVKLKDKVTSKPKTKIEEKEKKLKTPQKKSPTIDKDPLKNLNLDSSISCFLSTISQHPAINKKHEVTYIQCKYCTD